MAVGVCSGIFFFFASFIRQIRTEHLLWTGDHASSWGISCKYHEICLRQLLSLKVPVWILSSILTSSKLLSHHIQNKLAPISQSIKMVERNINNLRYADDTTLMAESEEELKSLLMKVKEESEKTSLKFNIQKTKIMASCPITSWQIDGKTMEQWQTLFLGLQNHCRWWLKPWN